MSAKLDTLSRQAAHGGTVGYYRHQSAATGTAMTFALFEPPAAKDAPVPVVTYLAGLTCNHETFMIKAGALKRAAELGLLLAAELADYLAADSDRAAERYLTFVDTYPLSIYADAARLRYRELRPGEE